MHSVNTPCQQTLSMHPFNAPFQHTLSTYPVNTPCQHALSTNPVNTPCQCTLSTHPVNAPCQHTLSTHPIDLYLTPPHTAQHVLLSPSPPFAHSDTSSSSFTNWIITVADTYNPPLVFSISYSISEHFLTFYEVLVFDIEAKKLAIQVTLLGLPIDIYPLSTDIPSLTSTSIITCNEHRQQGVTLLAACGGYAGAREGSERGRLPDRLRGISHHFRYKG